MYETEATHSIPEVTGEEVLVACDGIGDGKTPGPDGIPNRALKAAIRLRPDMFARVFNKCFVESVFPLRWQEQKLAPAMVNLCTLLLEQKCLPNIPTSGSRQKKQTYVHTYIHTYIHIHIHTYIHT